LRGLPLFELRGAGEGDVTRQVQGRAELSGESFDLPARVVEHGSRIVHAELLADFPKFGYAVFMAVRRQARCQCFPDCG
jgi:hypothetical protein